MEPVHAPYAGIVHYHKRAGETVAAGEVIATIETTKLEGSIESPVKGTVLRCATPDYADVEGGDPLVYIEGER